MAFWSSDWSQNVKTFLRSLSTLTVDGETTLKNNVFIETGKLNIGTCKVHAIQTIVLSADANPLPTPLQDIILISGSYEIITITPETGRIITFIGNSATSCPYFVKGANLKIVQAFPFAINSALTLTCVDDAYWIEISRSDAYCGG